MAEALINVRIALLLEARSFFTGTMPFSVREYKANTIVRYGLSEEIWHEKKVIKKTS